MLNRLKPLTTLPFLICLAVLLLNDFYLKNAFHNTLTGKLSDFSGLFIFPIFWSVFLPKRKIHVFFLTGIFFIYWKSEYSSSFIEFFSNIFFPIQRIVDPTDLIALIMLPLAWYSLKIRTINLKFNPSFVAPLAFFSFCATTLPKYYQTFDQPQYVLFKSNVLPDTTGYNEDFTVYQFDSLLVVEVKQIITGKEPIKRDDYDKNIVLHELEESIRNQMPAIENSMTPGKITEIRIKTPHYEDFLRFNGGRLDGPFVRKNGKNILIEGFYNNGIEDSIWTYIDNDSAIVTKKTFVNGETTKIERFNGNHLISSDRIGTRADTIVWNYVQLVVLLGFIIFMIILIVKNYRATYPETLKITRGWKWVLCFSLPIVVSIAQIIISIFIIDQYSKPLDPVMIFVLMYMLTPPLFLLIAFGIKWRKEIDILWYCILLALLSTFIMEFGKLIALSS